MLSLTNMNKLRRTDEIPHHIHTEDQRGEESWEKDTDQDNDVLTILTSEVLVPTYEETKGRLQTS